MEEAIYNNCIFFCSEIKRIREALQQRAPEVLVNFFITARIVCDVSGAGVKSSEKFLALPVCLALIPTEACNGIRFDFPKKRSFFLFDAILQFRNA